MRLNIVKTGFFIPLKGHKSNSAFVNFCFSFYRDDFYILVLARPLKVGPTKLNASKGRTSKPGLHRPNVMITVSAARVWACGGRCVGVGTALVQCRVCQGKQ